jgi:hypothetical protein
MAFCTIPSFRSAFIVIALLIGAEQASAVPMVNDPKGFHNIAWGASLTSREDLEITHTGSHVTEYQRRSEPESFAGVQMTSIRYVSVDGQFARVVIRYHGEQTHKQVLTFLETTFGSLERIPGQMARGLTQQYNWRGSDTEINLTYQAGTERGYVFIDSRVLAPRFNDNLADSAE